MNYSEIFGDIIKNDIIKIDTSYEFDNEQGMFDVAIIRISSKDNYLNITNINRIIIIYYYSNKLKKLAKELQQLYEEKLNNKDVSYEEYNKKIGLVRQEIKEELLKNSPKYSVSVSFNEIVQPKDFVDKTNIAIEILENGETNKEYKIGNPFLMILIQALRQMKNFIKNIFIY